MMNNGQMRDAFFHQALKGDKSWVWYFISAIAIIVAYGIGQIPILVLAAMKQASGELSQQELKAFSETADFSLLGISSTTGLFLVILGFITALGALFLLNKYLHKRSFQSLITAFEKVRWGRIWFAFGFWMLITVLIEVVMYLMHPDSYTFDFQFSKFVPLLAVTLVFIPFQTSFEEIVMRGYAMQGIGLWARYRLVPILITAVFFGLLHIFNPEIHEFGMGVMLTYYISVGAFLAVITVMDEGLELALGIHAATNIYGAAFVTFTGSALQTDAPVRASEINAPLMLGFFIFSALVFLAISSRKYGWESLAKVFGRIQFPETEPESAIANIE
jgi:membrane protease YdiL (CAAX protease family)